MPFSILPSSHYQRDVRRYSKKNPSLVSLLRNAQAILSQDPTNSSGQYPIEKLTGVKPGEGQWRIRLGEYRMRYDVFSKANQVVLYSFRHRRDVYKR